MSCHPLPLPFYAWSCSITNGSKLSVAGYVVFGTSSFEKGMNGLIRLSMNYFVLGKSNVS